MTDTAPKRIVFCDFDGTITAEETFVAMLREFTPDVAAKLMPQIYDLTLTLREGVRQMLESIPSSRYPEVLEFAKTKAIRPGLVELLDFLDDRQVPFVVISGGLTGMVETVLGDLNSRVLAIHAVDVDTSGEYFQPRSSCEGETEFVAKVEIVKGYGVEDWVAIGDSVTDLNMAMAAPLVFARHRLCQYLDERGKAYEPFETFFDVLDRLKSLWSGDVCLG
ncbi:MAG: HAD-IB family phosphatase [Cyanobacteria bacterium SID2]|nr:HAD-IB family phosphatase [Cyanobacteria bacterium SID2]MBP0002604.1 HAD-IB family phosphatase [Cyanobacteria bacterium SBC]